MTVYDLGKVKGDPGAKGDPGKSVEITEATVEYTEGESSVDVNKSESDDKDEYTFAFHLKTPEGSGGTSLPDGGTTGQVLVKQSDENGDADWQTFVGEKGEQGDPGDPGAPGAPGAQGEPGKKATMKIGTVETATKETEPNVFIESEDSEENSYTLGFVLPRGKSASSEDKEDITLSTETESVELSPSSATATVVVSGIQTKNVVVTCSDDEVANVTQSKNVEGHTLQLTITSDVNGDAKITVIDNGDDDYNQSNTLVVTVTSSGFSPIYGAEWDGTGTSLWSRINDSRYFSDPTPSRSGALKGSSPFDECMPWSGMTRSNRAGGAMVSIPKFWYKLTPFGDGGMRIQISPTKRDGYHVSPAHMDRGDGGGERETVYVGRYNCSETDYKSTSGVKPKVSVTRDTARTAINKINSKLYMLDFATLFTIWMLYLVEIADWDSQKVIGYGGGGDISVTGYTDEMPYHTGTMLSRTEYGHSIQYRYIEGLWDNASYMIDGCYYVERAKTINIILNPKEYSDTSGGVSLAFPIYGREDYSASKFNVINNAENLFPVFLPSEAIGSESTFSCDLWSPWEGSCPYFGGYSSRRSNGLFYNNSLYDDEGYKNVGCRLQELP